MDTNTERVDRTADVRRIFEEYGFENAQLLASWDGDDVEYFADLLTEEEYQTLLDELADLDEG